MPVFIPKVVSRCLGISGSNENSPSSSCDASLAGEVTSVANRRGGKRPTNAPTAAAPLEPVPGPSGRAAAMKGMAADWRDGALPPDVDPVPIPLWGRDELPENWHPSFGARKWAVHHGVNPATLISVDGKCTRFGLVELGGHRFIVGPRATPGEGRVLTRMLKANPQIGAIFSVEPGAMADGRRGDAPSGSPGSSGYRERPFSGYISSTLGAETRRCGDASSSAVESLVPLQGGLAHVQFMEFTGMNRFDAQISSETLWHAGRGVAEFMRQNPGRIALVCSESGVARPCAVIASAALQLEAGNAQLRNGLGATVVAQRARYSDHHINLAARSFDLIAEFARLRDVLRRPGRGDLDQERKIHLLKARLPELAADQCADQNLGGNTARSALATLLEDNFACVSPALVSGGLPPNTALLWLRDEINIQRAVRFLNSGYIYGHIDRISQEEIEPDHPDAIRLVSVENEGLTCDNKYYDAASVADWYRQCRLSSRVMSNPVSRAPVIALLVSETEKARLEPLFRRSVL